MVCGPLVAHASIKVKGQMVSGESPEVERNCSDQMLARHCDANLKLVYALGHIIIHIGVDGQTRKIMYAVASCNKRPETPKVYSRTARHGDLNYLHAAPNRFYILIIRFFPLSPNPTVNWEMCSRQAR